MIDKNYLQETRQLVQKMLMLEAQIGDKKGQAYSISSAKYGEKVSHSKNKDAIADKIVEYADLESVYAELLDEWLNRYKEIYSIVGKTTDFTLHSYIMDYYVNGKTVGHVAFHIGISERHLYRMQTTLIEEFMELQKVG